MALRKHTTYTAADFERYHSGAMDEAEMHALEKAALDDSFLSDALDGYAFTTTANADLDELKNRLQQKSDTRKRLVLFGENVPWLRVAAGIIFIAGTLYIAVTLNRNSNEIIVAKVNDAKSEQQAVIKTDPDKNIPGEQPEKNDGAETNSKIVSEVTRSTSQTQIQQKDNSQDTKTPEVTFADVSRKEQVTEIAGHAEVKAEESFSTKSLNSVVSKKVATTPLPANPLINNEDRFKLSGTVLDDQGNAVPYAQISDAKTKNDVVSDVNGKFSIDSKDSVLPATVTAVGYATIVKDLGNDIDQTVVLSPSSKSLNEVVVTAQGTKRQSREIGYSTSVFTGKVPGISLNKGTEPLAGKNNYDQYLKDSISKSLQSNAQFVKGAVILSFKVKKNGELTDIKIEKNLCKPCDEEAKRLLMNGPKWKYIANGRTTVTIHL